MLEEPSIILRLSCLLHVFINTDCCFTTCTTIIIINVLEQGPDFWCWFDKTQFSYIQLCLPNTFQGRRKMKMNGGAKIGRKAANVGGSGVMPPP